MAISWFTKQRLRLNPNYIFRVKRESVTDEMIDYVLSRPNLDNELIKRLIYEFENNNQLSEGSFQKIIDNLYVKIHKNNGEFCSLNKYISLYVQKTVNNM